MFAVLISVCLVPAVVSIIVTDPPPTSTEYNYSYNILDPHTGDTKSLHEVRQGDLVTGSYTVVDPDGTQRVVEYRADSRTGFKAVVHSEPIAVSLHQAVRNHHYTPRGNTRYVNQYYTSSHTLYEQSTASPYLTRTVSKYNRQKNKNTADVKQPRFFTPGSEVNPKPTFNRGEYFAPNNN